LNVTRIELGKIQLYKRPIIFADLIERAAREMEPLAHKKSLSLIRQNDIALSRVVCDPANLYHALINMIDNAIKYTASGSITVLTKREGTNVVVEVRDTGIGLSESDRHSLFNIYERGVSAVNLQSRGEGLGLFIAKQFVEAHGGTVFFDSLGPGRGSTFGFRLPIGKTIPEELA
jgi:signal transduction histidine kinase